ncbi:MAG TPA: hypothetical protein VFT43_16310 [Candidatus Polarisedimenticolia bacterium]|nr:hypothetical protein [Candidatus Polarisedimenticolia bacterium]
MPGIKRPGREGHEARRRTSATLAAVAILALLSGAASARSNAKPAAGAGARSHAPTRADLEALRRHVSLLEAELSLASTRWPFVVLDLETRTLSYRLMGMTVREVPIDKVEARGLRAVVVGKEPDPAAVAGIFSVAEKEKDPRLSPLTPEQIEAGAADENAADALPPETPAIYSLQFKQAVVIQVNGTKTGTGVGALLGPFGRWWRSLWTPGPRSGEKEAALRVTLVIEDETARQLYRALIPGERFVLVPPAGLLLPASGQEPPRSIRPPRAAPVPAPTAPPAPAPGVPFQIPPPVEGAGQPAAGEPVEPRPVPGSPDGVTPPPAPGAPDQTPPQDRETPPGDPPPPSATPSTQPASPPR